MSRDDEPARPIIIRRAIAPAHHGYHGGSWKIAYADFVTAMMAFFILLWLLSSTPQEKLEGISDYFNNPENYTERGGASLGQSAVKTDGGRIDLQKPHGQVRHESADPTQTNEVVMQMIDSLVERDPRLKSFKEQLLIDVTTEGLRVQIVDKEGRPMFDTASHRLHPYARDILHALAPALNNVKNRLSLTGHTDAREYSSGPAGFTNWELSTERANASRRALIEGGLATDKIARVTGVADLMPLVPEDPFEASNRRITLIALNDASDAEVGPTPVRTSRGSELASSVPVSKLPQAAIRE